MQYLTEVLGMDAGELASRVGVTVRTVRAWMSGARRPAEWNRQKLFRLVDAAQGEYSARKRWSAVTDAKIRATRKALLSRQERAHLAELLARPLFG